MVLTRFSDYSLRVVMYLARRPSSEKLATLNELSEFYTISKEHLRKVIHRLAQCGYINSYRGKKGGFELNVKSNDIRLGKFIVDMGEDFEIVDCAQLKCNLNPVCSLKSALSDASQSFIDTLNDYTLADIVEDKELSQRFGRLIKKFN